MEEDPMKLRHFGPKRSGCCILVLVFFSMAADNGLMAASPADLRDGQVRESASVPGIPEITNLLNGMALESSNVYFSNHCLAIVSVLDAVAAPTPAESLLLEDLFRAFTDTAVAWNASLLSSYLERKRPFILSWTSAADGAVSLAWLIPPENWDPERAYPLYVRLHGLSDIYGSRIQYLTRYLGTALTFEGTFEDGYTLLPWGRGNLWYQGIADADVWECIGAAEAYVHVDNARKYLVGMSMGGYGAWRLGQESPGTWAAVGVFAGALWYDGGRLLNEATAQRLKDVPIYIVCGTNDGLLPYNETALELLQAAGDQNLEFATFPGGHEAPLAQWQDMYGWIRNFTKEGTDPADPDEPDLPSDSRLVGNYPNPFNSGTVLLVEAGNHSDASLTVADAAGRIIRTLKLSALRPGRHEIRWDGLDGSGVPAPAGVYVCSLSAGNSRTSLKILMLK
jgi:hypothetical protein